MEIDEENKQNQQDMTKKVHKQRKRLPFPTVPFKDATEIANAIWQYASGQKIRRITLFDQLGKSPDSGPSRTLISLSSKYGLTSGGYQAEFIELTNLGATATNPDLNSKEKYEAQFELCIKSNEYFYLLYNNFKDMKLPSEKVMADLLIEKGLSKDECKACVDIFIVNCKDLNILQVLSGAERILNYDHWLDTLGFNREKSILQESAQTQISETKPSVQSKENEICFYIAPIGEENSEQRKHSDLFLNSIVEPALKDLNLKVVRADAIEEAGLITSQIIDLIKSAKLVVADLSFHNPNVFYELAFRHSLNLPTLHIIRKADSIPFDLNNFRTIVIDDTDIYTLVPQIDTFKKQITMQAKNLLENSSECKNPITATYK